MKQIIDLPVWELTEKLQKKEISATEATKSYLEQIKSKDQAIGAYLTVTEQQALQQAARIDERRKTDTLHPLAGVPMGIKDNICTNGIKTTCASKMLSNFIPPYSETIAEKLEDVGAILLGKLNMDEFAMGSSTENSAFYPVKNPIDNTRVPGGSSGGSAAAVAAREAAFALGSDTGGSIRQPASFCGVVGMKPTYGSISRYGLIAFASSLDQIGPLTKTVKDSALILSAICGHDKNDSTSIAQPYPDYLQSIKKGVKDLKIALPHEFLGEGVSAEVKDSVLQAAKKYEKMGAVVEKISMPSLTSALPAYYVISSAEASSNLARFDGVRYGYRTQNYNSMEELYKNSRSEGFGKEVKRRIMLGTFTLSAGYYDAYYKKALQVRTLIMQDFAKTFEKYDIIIAPTAPTVAYKFGEKSNPMEMYRGDICTVPINIAGVPALSMPCGNNADGLPIGLQIIAKAFQEPLIYQAAYALEQFQGGVEAC